MRVNKNGKPDAPRMWDTVVHANGSAELVGKDCNKDPSATLGMTIWGGGIVSPRRGIECLGEAQFAVAA